MMVTEPINLSDLVFNRRLLRFISLPHERERERESEATPTGTWEAPPDANGGDSCGGCFVSHIGFRETDIVRHAFAVSPDSCIFARFSRFGTERHRSLCRKPLDRFPLNFLHTILIMLSNFRSDTFSIITSSDP